jgi:hypothetical protein
LLGPGVITASRSFSPRNDAQPAVAQALQTWYGRPNRNHWLHKFREATWPSVDQNPKVDIS